MFCQTMVKERSVRGGETNTSSCGADSGLASDASIGCINSIWQGYGCTPNLVKTSNPNVIIDGKTNQAYDITGQTIAQVKANMITMSKNRTYCY